MPAWQGRAGPGRAAAFSAALRHSARVRKLRLMLPACALAIIVGIAGVKMLTVGPISNVTVGKVSIEDGKLTMENARVTGYRTDARSYELLAQKAIQDPADTSIVNLEKVDGTMTKLGEEGWTRLTADHGVYFTEKEKMDLSHNVVVTNDKGQVVHLNTAQVDLKGGDVITDQPVVIEFLNGTLQAQSMRIQEKGDIMRFNGAVQLNFMPEKGDKPDAQQ